MAVFKCKMCGGALEINNNESVFECDYCGTKQTLPKLSDERKVNLYDRANHFRRNNEFDKAMGIYEQILNEDRTDAESYWSLVLCRYGIEYVEDPATNKRVPTVNRAQFTSVFDDEDYKSALQNADGVQKLIYEDEAKAINEIQKGILAISQNEEPFDVFICYKETDNNGRRTQDSVIATELYHELTREGYKVFFSRITLEDKLGSAYEPYIFAALNSSKVMVVLGTKPEYFNAVWVKNEWSRYLALIKNGAQKILIPAYRDMDPYDLPEEFSHLQAQDMSKLGFMQDLIRGINKLAKTEDSKRTSVKETVITGSNSSVEPLLKRVFIFLEDSDWKSADEYCEKVLDIDPENAEAYLGKLMAELHVASKNNLKNCAEPFDKKNNYQKAVRFADEELKIMLKGYIEYINTRNENARLDGIYARAVMQMSAAKTEKAYKEAAALFSSVPAYQDSASLAKTCLEKAEIARKDAILEQGKTKMAVITISNYEAAIGLFESVPGWKDADEELHICKKKIEELKAKAEADRIEKERKAETKRVKAKKGKKIAVITMSAVGAAACAVIAFVVVLNNVIIPGGKYNNALSLMDEGKYNEAISIFEALDGYKDSANKITECNTVILDSQYNEAIALMDEGKYNEAISIFEALDGYKDSANKITECNTAILDSQYNEAIALMDIGKLDEAYSIFKELGNYKDAVDKAGNVRLLKIKGQLKNVKAGDYIKFGAYEQDNNSANGNEEVEWLVLEVKNGKALVISKFALDCKEYNTSLTDVTWETCTLRQWLNNDFINSAFTAYEKAMIPTVTVFADKNPEYDTSPGNATEDQVFLLSITEANKYFSYDSARHCTPTDYAVANGAWSPFFWWLRSPGYLQSQAAKVLPGGAIFAHGYNVTQNGITVRPAMWIDFNY